MRKSSKQKQIPKNDKSNPNKHNKREFHEKFAKINK